jgi:hypothetical protein
MSEAEFRRTRFGRCEWLRWAQRDLRILCFAFLDLAHMLLFGYDTLLSVQPAHFGIFSVEFVFAQM